MPAKTLFPRFSIRAFLAIAAFVLPIVTLLPLGLFWLWQQDLLIEWLLVLAVFVGGSWLVLWVLNRKSAVMLRDKPEVEPSPIWPEGSRPAWDRVTEIADRLDPIDYPLDNPTQLLELAQQTIEGVARHYYPASKNAPLEIAIPYLLVIIERVSQDLRKLLDHIPFSHALTIHDLMRGHGLASFARRCYDMYRWGSLAINPVGAVLRELRALTAHQILKYPTEELKLWLLQSYVKKVGYYAIELYSGTLTLSDKPTIDYITRYSQKDLERSQEKPLEEPLRLVVLGQVKSGKSSLINALFGEMRAMTDVLPLTAEFTPYLLEREGMEQMLILDSRGYAGPTEGQGLDKTEAEIVRSDLIVLVCSAISAARHPDRQLLQRIRDLFQSHPELNTPPILVILSHIDRLRPVREWAPPYNIVQPQRPKEQAIRKAMEATAKDLGVELSDIIPVRLQAGHGYNIEEGVIPAILVRLDRAQQVKYLRCLREQRREDYWNRLREQAWRAGRIVLDASARIAAETAKKLGDEITKRLRH
jgi:predicted GTPase